MGRTRRPAGKMQQKEEKPMEEVNYAQEYDFSSAEERSVSSGSDGERSDVSYFQKYLIAICSAMHAVYLF